jgi:uncharacterized protein (DUF58 family)
MYYLPTSRLVWLLVGGAPLWLVALVMPGGLVVGLAYLVLLGGLILHDLRSAPPQHAIQVARHLPPRLSLDTVHALELTVHHQGEGMLTLHLRDELPTALALLTPLPVVTLAPYQTGHVRYHVRALQRGLHHCGAVVMRVERPGALVQQQMHFPLPDAVKVYPQFVGVRDYALLARIDQRDEVVRRPRTLRGSGTDFESLRPYVPGDDIRRVDWKASARRNTLISRNLQVEKGQQVAVLIDAGRLMTEQIGALSRFEHALNATVMLSYVAQQRGDSIAVATFSNRLESFLPPTRGPRIMPQVLESLYQVQPRTLESDYWQVVAEMMHLLKRRSLVIMLTDVLDTASSAGLMSNLVRAAARHLVLCVVMEDPAIVETATALPPDLNATYAKAAASQLILQRHLALEQMRARGILVLESPPGRFSIQLVRRYLAIRQEDLQ